MCIEKYLHCNRKVASRKILVFISFLTFLNEKAANFLNHDKSGSFLKQKSIKQFFVLRGNVTEAGESGTQGSTEERWVGGEEGEVVGE